MLDAPRGRSVNKIRFCRLFGRFRLQAVACTASCKRNQNAPRGHSRSPQAMGRPRRKLLLQLDQLVGTFLSLAAANDGQWPDRRRPHSAALRPSACRHSAGVAGGGAIRNKLATGQPALIYSSAIWLREISRPRERPSYCLPPKNRVPNPGVKSAPLCRPFSACRPF